MTHKELEIEDNKKAIKTIDDNLNLIYQIQTEIKGISNFIAYGKRINKKEK